MRGQLHGPWHGRARSEWLRLRQLLHEKSHSATFADQVSAALLEALGQCQIIDRLPPLNVKIAAHAIQAAKCALNVSRSQHTEDLLLLPSLLRAVPHGSTGQFVELGAFDGIRFSNTLSLERCFGWTGLLIEGNPNNFRRLQRSGRRATVVHAAVCNRTNATVEFSVHGEHMAAQLEVMDAHHWKRVHSVTRGAGHSNNKTTSVPCQSLTALMHSAGLAHATFLSLDVEGSEHLVLEAVDPSIFELIMVERNFLRSDARDARIRHRLRTSGMLLARNLVVPNSRIYVKNRRIERAVIPRNATHAFEYRRAVACVKRAGSAPRILLTRNS